MEPRQVYRGALTVMMRLVFLLYAEEQRLLPVDSELYADCLLGRRRCYDQLEAERNLYGDEVADRRAAAWPRLLATFAAVYGGCEHDEMRIPPYGGGMFDPARYPWLDRLAVTDRVVHEMLGALLILQRGGSGAERLSYKGLDVEQIGHVYEGLLEFSCLRVDEPYLGLIGKLEPEIPLAELEAARTSATASSTGWPRSAAPLGERAAQGHGQAARRPSRRCTRPATTTRTWPNGSGRCAACSAATCAACPTVFPAGSLIITQVGDRRATGTHYTPRKLAEEIVKYTLEPLCYSPGPADGADPADWQVRPAAELLDLKVLDPAMGSGAFLVSACRYLAERLVEAWDRDGYPDAVLDAARPRLRPGRRADLEARRRVAARCLYGVDRDDAAVELGKLSLWLVTLAKDKPFSFLDHALRCGDSLVGLISESQVDRLPPRPGRPAAASTPASPAPSTRSPSPILTRVRDSARRSKPNPSATPSGRTRSQPSSPKPTASPSQLRDLADAVAAAALSTAGQPDDAFDDATHQPVR